MNPDAADQARTALNSDGLLEPINLKNHPLAELMPRLTALGVPEVQVRQIMARVIKGNNPDLSGLRGLSRVRQALLADHTLSPRLELVERVDSPVDHFTKFLFRTHDGHMVETVRIPLLHNRYSVCISSQVGCALGCTFCATGLLGFSRNLEPWEMVDQLLQAREGADRPVTGAVFMGQGEPFMNYENVIRAATILREPTGGSIRAQNITISTAGILPNIRRFTEERHPFRLIVSLSAGTSETRQRIMPIERKYPLAELAQALGEYARSRRTRATIAYVAIQDVNTHREELLALKELLKDVPVIFNMIEVNDPSGSFQAPRGQALQAFVDDLQLLEMPIVRRYTGGKDVSAACGMLASTVQAKGLDDAPPPSEVELPTGARARRLERQRWSVQSALRAASTSEVAAEGTSAVQGEVL